MKIAAAVHNEVSAVAPVHGVSIGTELDKATWRVDFKPAATPQQRADAAAAIAAFDIAAFTAAQSAQEATDDAEFAAARMHPQIIAMMNRTPAQIDTFVDNQVTNIAGVQAVLKIILRMIVVMLRRAFR